MQEDEQDDKDSVKEHEMLDVECSSEEEQRMDLIQEGWSEDDATDKGERRHWIRAWYEERMGTGNARRGGGGATRKG